MPQDPTHARIAGSPTQQGGPGAVRGWPTRCEASAVQDEKGTGAPRCPLRVQSPPLRLPATLRHTCVDRGQHRGAEHDKGTDYLACSQGSLRLLGKKSSFEILRRWTEGSEVALHRGPDTLLGHCSGTPAHSTAAAPGFRSSGSPLSSASAVCTLQVFS